MRNSNLSKVAVLCAAMLFILCSITVTRRGLAHNAPLASPPTVLYTVTDLGTFGGDTSSALGINDSGTVVGQADLIPGFATSHPFVYSGGVLTDIGTFGGNNGSASAINNTGQVAGYADLADGSQHPFYWTAAGGKFDLGPIISGSDLTVGFGINNAASTKIVGAGEISAESMADRGFVWTKPARGLTAAKQLIGTLGGPSSHAYGVNNLGHVVGTAQNSSYLFHAFIKTGTSLTDLGTFATGQHSWAYAINNSGVVVGASQTLWPSGAQVPTHAFIWTSSNGLVDIGTLSGGVQSWAYALNEANTVVGRSRDAAGDERAFIYDSVNGMRDLNDLTTGSGWTLRVARGINASGQIVGQGVNSLGQLHAFLLTPIP